MFKFHPSGWFFTVSLSKAACWVSESSLWGVYINSSSPMCSCATANPFLGGRINHQSHRQISNSSHDWYENLTVRKDCRLSRSEVAHCLCVCSTSGCVDCGARHCRVSNWTCSWYVRKALLVITYNVHAAAWRQTINYLSPRRGVEPTNQILFRPCPSNVN